MNAYGNVTRNRELLLSGLILKMYDNGDTPETISVYVDRSIDSVVEIINKGAVTRRLIDYI